MFQAFLIIQALADGGVRAGLSRQQATRLAAQVLLVRGKVKGVTIQINAGRSNSRLTNKEILMTLRKIPGVMQEDIGKIDIKDKITNIEILKGKERSVLKALRDIKIRGKLYRAKIKN